MKKKMIRTLSISLMLWCGASLQAAAVYYVDGKNGQDSYFGAQIAPWKTIQKAANTVLAGDTVLVAAGGYPERITVNGSGREGALIQFLANGAVECRGFTVKGNYIRIRGFKVTGSVPTWNDEGYGLWVEGKFCWLEDNFAYDGQRGGINLRPQSANCVVRGNRCYRNGMEGMEIHGTDQLVENNEVWGTIVDPPQDSPGRTSAAGIRFFGSGHIFRGNNIHDIRHDDPENQNHSPQIDAFKTWADADHAAASNILFEKNNINLPGYQNAPADGRGFMLGNCGDITIRNNIVVARRGIDSGAGDIDHIKILNNTLIGDLSYLRSNHPVGISLRNSPHSTIKNNIIYNQTDWAISLEGTTYAGLDMGNNCIYNTDGSVPLGILYPHDLRGIDPLFVNPVGDDYHLKSGSPCIDAGAPTADVSEDYDNYSRPAGPSSDIGAFEYQGDAAPAVSSQSQDRAVESGRKSNTRISPAGSATLSYPRDQGGAGDPSDQTPPSILASLTAEDWLHTDGPWIKDASGRVFTLRGVHMYVRLQNEQAKFAAAKAAGANVVRLAIWKCDIESPGTNDPGWDKSGLAAIDRAVGWAHGAGLRIILDQHIWTTDVAPAPSTFLSDPALQAQWLSMWRIVVDRYKNNPTVIGIDLMNEPWSISGVSASQRSAWEAIAENAVNDLKSHNPKLLFIVEGWGPRTVPAWQDIKFLKQPNIVYSDHIYYDYQISWNAWAKAYAAGDLTTGRSLLSQWADNMWGVYTNQGTPVWIGETGFLTSSPNWQEQMKDELTLFDQHGIGYDVFAYGANRWGLDLDIVNASYNLTTVGAVYSSQLKNFKVTTPIVSTTAVTAIAATSATSGGNVTANGGAPVNARGICWSTSANPTTANSKTSNGGGSGSYTSNMTGLTPNTVYHVRAYVTNSAGTAYGSDLSFKTSSQ